MKLIACNEIFQIPDRCVYTSTITTSGNHIIDQKSATLMFEQAQRDSLPLDEVFVRTTRALNTPFTAPFRYYFMGS